MTQMPFIKGIKHAFIRGLPLLLMLSLLSSAGPVFALWLPWATEESKVAKVVADVCQATVNNDQRFLAENVVGNGAKAFIDQEIAAVQSLGVKKYHCRIQRVTILPPDNNWAIVEFDKVATLGSGEEFANKAFSILGKADGAWKITIGVGDKMKAGQDMLNLIRQGAGVPGQRK
ncbi:MAG: hypothetical protein HY913_17930 [Desulfomonile tiedjei]|nr:hypothetical protein [Desulfomonile tiedjei]